MQRYLEQFQDEARCVHVGAVSKSELKLCSRGGSSVN